MRCLETPVEEFHPQFFIHIFEFMEYDIKVMNLQIITE